jgi:membrane AbrB-like protein
VLPYVLALAADGRGDPARVAVIQVCRLTTLLLVLPSILTLFGDAPRATTLTPSHPVLAVQIALLLAGSAVGAFIFALLKAPAPSLFGSMIAASLLYGTGLLTSGIPEWLAVTAFIVIGSTIGSNFVGIDRPALIDSLLAGLGSLVVGVLVAMVCAIAVGTIVGLSVEQLWIAYAPGGIDVMTVLALAMGYDTAFIGGHHVARFLGLGVIVPLWLGKRSARSSET